MAPYKHLLKPEFSLQKEQREALGKWLAVQIQETQGGGWDVQVKGVRLRAGQNGMWRLGNVGVGIVALLGIGMLTGWASGGQVKLQWWQSALMTPALVAAADSMRGAGSAYKVARAQGAGAFKAFSTFCRRVGLGMAGATPNAVVIPFLGLGGVLKLAAKLSGVVSIKQPGGKLEAWIQAAESKIITGVQSTDAVYEAVNKWKAGKLVRACALESSEAQGQSIYKEMAAKFMAQRLSLVGVGAEPGDERAGLLAAHSKEERVWADKFEPYLRRHEVDAEKIDLLMLRADMANVPPWHCPEPGMPTLYVLAASLANWSGEANQDISETLDERLDGWAARCEAQEIQAHLGAVRPAWKGRSGPTRKRL